MMRVILSKLKDDGGIDIRGSASGGRIEQGQSRIKTLLSAEFVSPCSSSFSDKTEQSLFLLFFYFSFFLAKLSKVKVGWTLLGADFFPKDTFRISGAVTTWWRWGWHGKGIKHCNYFGWSAFNCRFIKHFPRSILMFGWHWPKVCIPPPWHLFGPKLNTAGVHFLVRLNSIQMWFNSWKFYLTEIELNDDPTFPSHLSRLQFWIWHSMQVLCAQCYCLGQSVLKRCIKMRWFLIDHNHNIIIW